MATKKATPEEATQHADATTDEGAAPEPTTPEPSPAAAADAGTTPAAPEPPPSADDEPIAVVAADAGTTPAASEPPPPADDEPEQPLPELTVLILRDETIGGKDYRPGDTPKLPGAEVEALVARKAGDINHKAIAAARKARNGGANEEAVIE